MNNLLIFGLGILCGFIFSILVLFLYCCLRINKDDENNN